MRLFWVFSLLSLFCENVVTFKDVVAPVNLQFDVTVKAVNAFLKRYFLDPNVSVKNHIAFGISNSFNEYAFYHCDIIQEIIDHNSNEFSFTFLSNIFGYKIKIKVQALTILIADDIIAFR